MHKIHLHLTTTCHCDEVVNTVAVLSEQEQHKNRQQKHPWSHVAVEEASKSLVCSNLWRSEMAAVVVALYKGWCWGMKLRRVPFTNCQLHEAWLGQPASWCWLALDNRRDKPLPVNQILVLSNDSMSWEGEGPLLHPNVSLSFSYCGSNLFTSYFLIVFLSENFFLIVLMPIIFYVKNFELPC